MVRWVVECLKWEFKISYIFEYSRVSNKHAENLIVFQHAPFTARVPKTLKQVQKEQNYIAGCQKTLHVDMHAL